MNSTVKILTICDQRNYGNRLQNYAVQWVLEKLGCDVLSISVEKRSAAKTAKMKALLQKLSGYHLPGDKMYWKAEFPRSLAFDRFNRKYIPIRYVKSIVEIGEADYFVTGSDQVWNANWYPYLPIRKDAFLLSFAKPEQKVCFSPSFGVEELPEEWAEWFRTQLATFPRISVREEAGARIVRELTGKEAEVLIDPTMMLDASDWLKIAKAPKKVDCDRPYILTYFLGGRSERVERDLKRYAEENGFAVYHLMDREQPELYATGPSEFISLISHAKLVLTDSFHACVFSFLFQKPFLVYAREGKEKNMMSRLDTLLKKFHLERKYADSGLPNDLLEADYGEGYQQLKAEREKALAFLKESMHL